MELVNISTQGLLERLQVKNYGQKQLDRNFQILKFCHYQTASQMQLSQGNLILTFFMLMNLLGAATRGFWKMNLE